MNDMYRSLKRKNLVFYWTSAVLLVVLVLYPLFGGIMMSLVLPEARVGDTFSWFDEQDLSAIRMVQVLGQVLLLCIPVFFLAGFHTGDKRPFSRKNLAFLGLGQRIWPPGMFLAVAGVLLLQPFIYAVMEFIGFLLPHLGEFGRSLLDNQEQLERFLMFLAGADSLSEFLTVAVVVAIIPAVCEEVFFRGYIQKNYMDSLSPVSGILLTGFVFGLFHLSPANLVPLSFMGWYLGYVYYKTQNLMVPIMAHFCNNLLSLSLLQVQRNNTDIFEGMEIKDPTSVSGLLSVGVSLLLFAVVVRRFNRLFSASENRTANRCSVL